MNSVATKQFWDCFAALPPDVQRLAESTYRLWRDNPRHSSLRFKRIHGTREIFSVRIGLHYRALGLQRGEVIAWFWIGSHADYDRLVARLR